MKFNALNSPCVLQGLFLWLGNLLNNENRVIAVN